MEEWWYRLTRRQRWVIAAAVAAYFVLSFISAGVWAFVTVLLVVVVCCPLSWAFGEQAARRELERRIELTNQQYANTVEAATRAIQAHADLTRELAQAREDLSAATRRQLDLAARLAKAGLSTGDDTEEIASVAEASPSA
ncbi:hypothetical protein ACFMQL_20305 [Nonomuraea fastidiosa]|uniref:hypothetical protein n=1 Tax=Nonomuraea fastidiosa TaxID=46173 RepID=UPI00366D6E73